MTRIFKTCLIYGLGKDDLCTNYSGDYSVLDISQNLHIYRSGTWSWEAVIAFSGNIQKRRGSNTGRRIVAEPGLGFA